MSYSFLIDLPVEAQTLKTFRRKFLSILSQLSLSQRCISVEETDLLRLASSSTLIEAHP